MSEISEAEILAMSELVGIAMAYQSEYGSLNSELECVRIVEALIDRLQAERGANV